MNLYTNYYSSPIGLLKIQSTSSHITSLLFVEKEETLSSEITFQIGDALKLEKEKTPLESNKLINLCINQLDEYFSGERKTFDLPMHQEGTIFQQKVWDLLYEIPFGKTISYQDLAKKYGDQKAIRAIASANGKNNIAIIVPCHRVIGSNRSLTGYAGGLSRKQWLLDHEAKHFSGLQYLSPNW